jgi:osmotically-inducible protein OsmY
MQRSHESYQDRDRRRARDRGEAQRARGRSFEEEEHPRDDRGRFVDDDEDDDRQYRRSQFGDRESSPYHEERGAHRGGQWEPERDDRGRFTGSYAGEYGESGDQRGRSAESSRQESGRSQRRGPHAGKGPKGFQRSEQRILEDVNEALSQHGDLDASDIEVKWESGGVVVLLGTVESRQAKRAAEECVEDLPGVKDVRNELRVQQQASSESSQREGQRPTHH